MMSNIENGARQQRVMIYDSFTAGAGERLPAEIKFNFGADATDNGIFEHLVSLTEHRLTVALLDHPPCLGRLFETVGLQYPNIWALVEPLSVRMTGSWPKPKPGDLDIVCGAIVDGRPQLDGISCIQIKVRRHDGEKTKGETGTEQAELTSHLGFYKTVLLHLFVQVPVQVEKDEAASYNPLRNSDFTASTRRTLGLMREKLKQERLPYGYTILGWGQAFGKGRETCGGLTFDEIKAAPIRPFTDTATVYLEEIRQSVARLLSCRQVELPLYVKRQKD